MWRKRELRDLRLRHWRLAWGARRCQRRRKIGRSCCHHEAQLNHSGLILCQSVTCAAFRRLFPRLWRKRIRASKIWMLRNLQSRTICSNQSRNLCSHKSVPSMAVKWDQKEWQRQARKHRGQEATACPGVARQGDVRPCSSRRRIRRSRGSAKRCTSKPLRHCLRWCWNLCRSAVDCSTRWV